MALIRIKPCKLRQVKMVTNTALGSYVCAKEQSGQSRPSHSRAGLLPTPGRAAEAEAPITVTGFPVCLEGVPGKSQRSPPSVEVPSQVAPPSRVRAWVCACVAWRVCVL